MLQLQSPQHRHAELTQYQKDALAVQQDLLGDIIEKRRQKEREKLEAKLAEQANGIKAMQSLQADTEKQREEKR